MKQMRVNFFSYLQFAVLIIFNMAFLLLVTYYFSATFVIDGGILNLQLYNIASAERRCIPCGKFVGPKLHPGCFALYVRCASSGVNYIFR